MVTMHTEVAGSERSPSSIFNKGHNPRRKNFQLPDMYEEELNRFALAHARKSPHTQRIYRSGATLFLAFLIQALPVGIQGVADASSTANTALIVEPTPDGYEP